MKSLLALVVCTVLSLALGGCGGSASCSGTAFGSVCLGFVNQGTLAIGSTISGSGTVIAETPLSGASSNNSFRLGFTLEDGGTVTLITNADATLGSAFKLEFKRAGTTLQVHAKGSGTDADLSGRFTGVDASTALTYQIDVHNSENPVHILIWDSTVTDFQNTAGTVDEETGTPAPGTGIYWGLELSNATVSTLAVGAQSYTE